MLFCTWRAQKIHAVFIFYSFNKQSEESMADVQSFVEVIWLQCVYSKSNWNFSSFGCRAYWQNKHMALCFHWARLKMKVDYTFEICSCRCIITFQYLSILSTHKSVESHRIVILSLLRIQCWFTIYNALYTIPKYYPM